MGEVLDYRNPLHMDELAFQLEKGGEDFHPAICAFITDHDLMRPQWWLRFLMWACRKRRGNSVAIWVVLEDQVAGSCADFIAATAHWIRAGRDRTTKDAAGGFNQGEVNLLAAALNSFAAIRKATPDA